MGLLEKVENFSGFPLVGMWLGSGVVWIAVKSWGSGDFSLISACPLGGSGDVTVGEVNPLGIMWSSREDDLDFDCLFSSFSRFFFSSFVSGIGSVSVNSIGGSGVTGRGGGVLRSESGVLTTFSWRLRGEPDLLSPCLASASFDSKLDIASEFLGAGDGVDLSAETSLNA